MQPILETKNDRESHDEDRHTTANGPEIALRSVCVGNASKVHAKIRCEEG